MEPVSRGGGAGQPPVACRQHLGNPLGRSPPQPDLDERAHHVSDHVVQERVGRHQDADVALAPDDARRPITRMEIVRIVPQAAASEEIEHLIDDPWRTFECAPDPLGCAETFTDAEFPDLERGVVYYARVFEAPQPAINAGNLRCERDAEGNCLKVHRCPGPQGDADECLAPREPRAWSSPIYVDFGAE